MKNILIITLLAFLLVVPMASALDFDNIKEYTKDVGDYGKIDVYNSYIIPGVIKGDKLADFELVENTYSIFDGYAKIEATLYSSQVLISKTNLYDKKMRSVDKNILKSFDIKVSELIDKSRQVITYETVCVDTLLDKGEIQPINETTSQTCSQVANKPITEYYTEQVDINYNIGDKIDAGNYIIELRGERDDISTGLMDWTIEAMGIETNEWETWWDTDWLYKREINYTANNGNMTTFTIPYNSNMLANFSDLRFLNFAQTTELKPTIRNKVDSNYIIVDVLNYAEDSIYVYYGNSLASSIYNFSDLYFDPISYYYMDELSGTTFYDETGLQNGTTDGGVTLNNQNINKSLYFTQDKAHATMDIDNYDEVTFSFWLNWTNGLQEYPVLFWEQDASWHLFYASITSYSTPANKFSLIIGNGATSIYIRSNDPIPTNTWTHILVHAKKNGIMEMYIDGVKQTNTATAPSWTSTRTEMYIMSREDYASSTASLNGQIDELIIYDKNLTLNQISYLASHTQPTTLIGSEIKNTRVKTTLQSPTNAELLSTPTPIFNWTILPTNVNITNWTLNVWFSNSTLAHTHQNLTINTNETLEVIHNDTLLIDESYIWTVESCGESATTNYCDTASNQTFSLDSTAPSINITSPLTSYNTLVDNQTLDLNWSVVDNNLDSCWYGYNQSNTTLTCGDNTTTFNYIAGINNITVYSNDTLGNVNNKVRSWIVDLIEASQQFSPEAIQTSLETFGLNLTKSDDVSSISGILKYNNEFYIGTVSSDGNDIYISTTIEIPTNTENITYFNWTVVYVTPSGTFNTTSSTNSQLISNLSIYECSSSPVDVTLNFTTYDADTLLTLNSSFEGTFDFRINDGGSSLKTYSYSSINQNKSNYLFCINSGNENVSVDAFISYYASGYDRREYILNGGVLGNFTQNIPLYLAPSSVTDIVTLLVYDSNWDPLEGSIVHVERWDVGTDSYYSVGMVPIGSGGKGIINLRLYDTWYRFVVLYNGVIVKTTDDEKLSSTEKRIEVTLSENNPYELFNSISYGVTYDNTTQVGAFTFADESGYSQEGCFVVTKLGTYADDDVYDNCISSTAGILSYTILENGTYELKGTIKLTSTYDNITSLVDSMITRVGTPSMTEQLSPYGKVASFLFLGTAVSIGIVAQSIFLGSALLVIVMIGIMKIGFLNITPTVFWGIISLVIIIITVTNRRNK